MAKSANNEQPPVPIIYEDNHLLVVEKPVNMLSQEDDTGDLDLLRYLKEDIKLRFNKPGNVFLGLVHRLDRPVGGVMVFARTSKAASRLSETIRNRTFHKTYLAVIHGQPADLQGRLVHHLFKDNDSNTVYAVSQDHAQAKEAVLDYEIIGDSKLENLCLAKIRLHTGRPHQIRVQFASIGCPLYGDSKYGEEINRKSAKKQIALWSAQLSFIHPTLHHLVTFQSLPPRTTPWNLWNITKI